VPASTDSDTATAQTIEIMAGHVRAAAVDGQVVNCARNAVSQFSGLGQGSGTAADPRSLNARAVAGAAFWWCKVYVRFVHHDFIISRRLGESGHLQGLISPEVLVRMENPEGDCAIFSECVAAFLTAFGLLFEFVTVAVNPNEPEIFSHVYLYAVMPDGSRLPLDASHGLYPGWQVPSSDVFKRQVWDANGNPVADRGSRFDGLHNYGMRGGLGAEGDFGGEYSPAGQEVPVDPYLQPGGTAYDLGPGYFGTQGQSPLTVPAQNSAQWGAFANSLKGVLTLAEMYALKPGTQVLPDGTVQQQNPGYAIGTPTGALNLGSGISTTTMLLIALGVGAVLMMSKGR
jgi:hypothetical protein